MESWPEYQSDYTVVLKLKLESIVFYPILTLHFEEILDDTNKHAFKLDHEPPFSSKLLFNTTLGSLIGVGGFKTAHTTQLLLNPIALLGLGSLPQHTVVLKQPYHRGDSTTNKQYKHYMLAQELPPLFWEVNVLYWASSLLQMTYEYIDYSICQSCDLSVPAWIANIPCLHFVAAGLALAYSPTFKGSAAISTESVTSAYLLEEKIKCRDGKFTKFIHNA
ncbi:hypothetical protein EDC04DRAFT_2584425 [Pisolithus marmoratus]|nr:hypothetical protein EDC04DRAFT_2584425 [Pisolithus marmoratus]